MELFERIYIEVDYFECIRIAFLNAFPFQTWLDLFLEFSCFIRGGWVSFIRSAENS